MLKKKQQYKEDNKTFVKNQDRYTQQDSSPVEVKATYPNRGRKMETQSNIQIGKMISSKTSTCDSKNRSSCKSRSKFSLI
jgi:hypothetical protein